MTETTRLDKVCSQNNKTAKVYRMFRYILKDRESFYLCLKDSLPLLHSSFIIGCALKTKFRKFISYSKALIHINANCIFEAGISHLYTYIGNVLGLFLGLNFVT